MQAYKNDTKKEKAKRKKEAGAQEGRERRNGRRFNKRGGGGGVRGITLRPRCRVQLASLPENFANASIPWQAASSPDRCSTTKHISSPEACKPGVFLFYCSFLSYFFLVPAPIFFLFARSSLLGLLYKLFRVSSFTLPPYIAVL